MALSPALLMAMKLLPLVLSASRGGGGGGQSPLGQGMMMSALPMAYKMARKHPLANIAEMSPLGMGYKMLAEKTGTGK